MVAYTLRPLLVFVEAALCLAISTESSGAPLHERVIGANIRCSIGLYLEQYGG